MKKTKQLVKIAIAIFMASSLIFIGNFNVKAEEVGDVASINGVGYATLQSAIAARQDGDTIVLLEDVNTSNRHDTYFGQKEVNVSLNLNEKKINGDFERVIDIHETNVKIHNGVITGSNKAVYNILVAGFYGTYANVTLENLTLENKNAGSDSIHVGQYGNVTINNVTSTSTLGGGIEAAGGTVEVSNSTFIQKEYSNYSSQLVAASGGDGVVNVYDGFIGKSEGYGAYIFNSGGKINIYGGDFSAEKAVLKVDKNTDSYEYGGPSTMNVRDGKFSGLIEVQEGAILNISGGIFANTGLKKEVFSNYVDLDKYKVIEKDGTFKVVPKIESIEIEQTNSKVQLGKKLQLTANVSPTVSSEKITWESLNPLVATVDETGEVTGVSVGKAKITATEDGKSAEREVQVYKIDEPVLPIPPVNDGKDTTIEVNEETSEVLSNSLGDVVSNIETTTAVDNDTKEKLMKAIEDWKQVTIAPVTEKLETTSAKVQEVIEKVEQVISEKATIAQYFDLSMMIKASGSELGKLNELSETASFTITVPTDLTKEGRTFYMVRIHDGIAEKIAGTLKGNEFTFESDKFSVYALVYEDTKAEDPGNEGETEDNEDIVDPGDKGDAVDPGSKEENGDKEETVDKEEPVDKVETEDKKDTTVDTGDTTDTTLLLVMIGAASLILGGLLLRKRLEK